MNAMRHSVYSFTCRNGRANWKTVVGLISSLLQFGVSRSVLRFLIRFVEEKRCFSFCDLRGAHTEVICFLLFNGN